MLKQRRILSFIQTWWEKTASLGLQARALELTQAIKWGRADGTSLYPSSGEPEVGRSLGVWGKPGLRNEFWASQGLKNKIR